MSPKVVFIWKGVMTKHIGSSGSVSGSAFKDKNLEIGDIRSLALVDSSDEEPVASTSFVGVNISYRAAFQITLPHV